MASFLGVRSGRGWCPSMRKRDGASQQRVVKASAWYVPIGIGQFSTDLQRDSRVADVMVGPPPPTNQEEQSTADRD
jgi:hypothetical protein